MFGFYQVLGNNKYFVWHVILPLILGVSLYVLFRHTMFMEVLDYFGWGWCICNIRSFLGLQNGTFPYWFKYSLPGGMWIYAFTSAILFNWSYTFTRQNMGWIGIVALFGVLYEISQYFEIVYGHYDVSDLLTNVGAMGLASLQLLLITPIPLRATPTKLHMYSALIVTIFALLAIISNGPADVLSILF